MARLTAQQKAHNRAVRKQERLNREYTRMLGQAMNIFNENAIGSTYGIQFEQYIKEMGTSVGLTKPTAKSIEALKKTQTREQLLQNVSRYLLLHDKYSAENLQKHQKIAEALKEEKKLNKSFKTGNSTVNQFLQDITKNARLFIQMLNEIISQLETVPTQSRSPKINEVLTNAKTLKQKIFNFIDYYRNEINNAVKTKDGTRFKNAFGIMQSFGNNLQNWVDQNDTIEITLLYNANLSGFESIIFPSDSIFGSNNDFDEALFDEIDSALGW